MNALARMFTGVRLGHVPGKIDTPCEEDRQMGLTSEAEHLRENILADIDRMLTAAREPMAPGSIEALQAVRSRVEQATTVRVPTPGRAKIRIPTPGVFVHPWVQTDDRHEFHPGGLRLAHPVSLERPLCVTATAFAPACHCGVYDFIY